MNDIVSKFFSEKIALVTGIVFFVFCFLKLFGFQVQDSGFSALILCMLVAIWYELRLQRD